MVNRIKHLDTGKPIQTTKTLEEKRSALLDDLAELQDEQKENPLNPDVISAINKTRFEIQNLENISQKIIFTYVSKKMNNLENQLFTINQNEKENPEIVGILLSVFLEGVLDIVQEVEIMEGTPKDLEVFSFMHHEIHHIESWDIISRVNNEVLRNLLYGSYLLGNRVQQRKENQEDDRIFQSFIHNPGDQAPRYENTSVIHQTYYTLGTQISVRQILILGNPQPQTDYNLNVFRYVRGEIFNLFSQLVNILRNQ